MSYTANSINSTTSYTASRKTEEKRDILGKDDFLKLLITELRYQDPMNPLNDREFIAQMAQFTSLEQLQNMNKLLEIFTGSQQALSMFAQATNLIGCKVKVDTGDEDIKEGLVEAVRFSMSGPVIIVDGKDYMLADLLEVSK